MARITARLRSPDIATGNERSTTTADLAERLTATLQAHEAELRHAVIRRLSLFGSVARDNAEADSDVDLAAEFDWPCEWIWSAWSR